MSECHNINTPIGYYKTWSNIVQRTDFPMYSIMLIQNNQNGLWKRFFMPLIRFVWIFGLAKKNLLGLTWLDLAWLGSAWIGCLIKFTQNDWWILSVFGNAPSARPVKSVYCLHIQCKRALNLVNIIKIKRTVSCGAANVSSFRRLVKYICIYLTNGLTFSNLNSTKWWPGLIDESGAKQQQTNIHKS